jgi:hypothetical protein
MKQEVVELGKYMPYTDVLINEVKERLSALQQSCLKIIMAES